MVVAGDAPLVADGGKLVATPTPFVSTSSGQLGPLHDEDRVVVLHMKAQGLVQAGGESGQLHLGEAVGGGVLDEPDLAAARAGQQLAVRPEGEAADFQDAIGRKGDCRDRVIR